MISHLSDYYHYRTLGLTRIEAYNITVDLNGELGEFKEGILLGVDPYSMCRRKKMKWDDAFRYEVRKIKAQFRIDGTNNIAVSKGVFWDSLYLNEKMFKVSGEPFRDNFHKKVLYTTECPGAEKNKSISKETKRQIIKSMDGGWFQRDPNSMSAIQLAFHKAQANAVRNGGNQEY